LRTPKAQALVRDALEASDRLGPLALLLEGNAAVSEVGTGLAGNAELLPEGAAVPSQRPDATLA